MTSILPLSLRKGLQISAAVTAAAVIALTPSGADAKMPNIKRQSNVNITFALEPLDETSSASGEAKIKIEQTRKSTETELEVEVEGLEPDTYSVDATLSDGTTIELGEIVVAGSTTTETSTDTADDSTETVEVELETEGSFEGSIAASVDANEIVTITVSTIPADEVTAPVVVLSGDAVVEIIDLNYFANVRVTAPPASALTTTPSATDETETEEAEETETEVESGKGKGKGRGKGTKASKVKKIHGHALVQVRIEAGVTKKESLKFIGFGAPASTTLDVVVNGEVAGTVTSTKQGKVKFRERDLTETVDLTTLDIVTITTEDGTPVMQADF